MVSSSKSHYPSRRSRRTADRLRQAPSPDWVLGEQSGQDHHSPPRDGGLQAAHGIEDLVVATNARILSAANLAALDEARLRFIIRDPHHARSRRP